MDQQLCTIYTYIYIIFIIYLHEAAGMRETNSDRVIHAFQSLVQCARLEELSASGSSVMFDDTHRGRSLIYDSS